MHIKRLADAGNAPADAACAHHNYGLAAGFILALGEITHHAAPEALGLIVARFRHTAKDAQHQRNRMFADGIGIAALSTREPNTCRAQHIAVILIRPGAGALHKAQAGRELGQIIAPQPGTDQHIGARNPRIQIIPVAHFKEINPGAAQREAIGKAIGDMGEADGEFLARRQHGVLLWSSWARP